MEILVAVLLAAIAWGVVTVVGYNLTPLATYNGPMGGLFPLWLFGFSGACVSFISFFVTIGAFRSARLRPLTHVPRFLVAGLVAGCLCTGAVYCGVSYMLRHPSNYMGLLEHRDAKPNNRIQATPDFAFLFIVAQVSGAPDAARSPKTRT